MNIELRLFRDGEATKGDFPIIMNTQPPAQKEEPFLMDQQQFQELTHDEKEEYRAQFKPEEPEDDIYDAVMKYRDAHPELMKEEPKEGERTIEVKHLDKVCEFYKLRIKEYESQIATLKAAETFSRGQMVEFADFAWHQWIPGYENTDITFEQPTTTDLLNDYIKQKQ